MGIKLNRSKKRNLLLSFHYRLFKLCFFMSSKSKLKFFLNMEWIFERLAHETSFKQFSNSEHPIRLATLNFLKDKIKSTDIVMDLGCHTGQLSSLIAKHCQKVIGVDFNSTYIENAKKLYPSSNLEFHCSDAFDYLKQSPEKVEVMILSHILEHLDNPAEFLMECKKYVNYIYIEVPDFDKTYLNQYRYKTENELIYTDSDHVSEFDREELDQLLHHCGLIKEAEDLRFGVMKIWCATSNKK